MIENLFERGCLIQYDDCKAVKEIEAKIHDSLDSQYNTKIVGAFLIFETQCSLKRAVKILKKENHPFKIKRAWEPTNYVWENLGISKKQ